MRTRGLPRFGGISRNVGIFQSNKVRSDLQDFLRIRIGSELLVLLRREEGFLVFGGGVRGTFLLAVLLWPFPPGTPLVPFGGILR